MLSRISVQLKSFLLFTALLVLEKPLFLAFHADRAGQLQFSDWLRVIWHGLPLDLSCAGFLTIVPALLAALSALFPIHRRIFDAYFAAAFGLVWIIAVADADIYTFWGTHMDAPTILFYLRDPGDAAASVTVWMAVRDALLMAGGWGISWGLYTILIKRNAGSLGRCADASAVFSAEEKKQLEAAPDAGSSAEAAATSGTEVKSGRQSSSPSPALPLTGTPKKIAVFLLTAAVGGALFIPIRGGFSTATMNVGRVYFSQNAFLNHAAVAPFWNFMDSFNWKRDFAEQYRFMDSAEARGLFGQLEFTIPRDSKEVSQAAVRLSARRPNVLLFILESFSGQFVEPLGGEPGVMPRISALFSESIAFTNIFASGTRTDSGVVAVLGGFPAQPKSRIMARPDKSLALPGIGKSLKAAGYDLAFYYGGDEDFANMRSYLVGNGFEKITGEKDFGRDEVRTKWGVYDHVLYRRLLVELDGYSQTEAGKAGRPFFKTALSLTSHEPFTIPTEPKFPGDSLLNRYKSSLAYADGALGDFLDEAKKRPWWKDTLVILVADHSTHYPDLKVHEPARYRIPLLWTGGAAAAPREVRRTGSQTDIAATLLGELGLDHSAFKFSKDLLDGRSPEYAFYTFSDGFGFIGADCAAAFDAAADKPLMNQGTSGGAECMNRGKAYLQTLFDELASLNTRK